MPGILMYNGFYAPPFDEGVKLVTHHLRQELSRLAPVHMVSSACGASGDAATVSRNPFPQSAAVYRRRPQPVPPASSGGGGVCP